MLQLLQAESSSDLGEVPLGSLCTADIDVIRAAGAASQRNAFAIDIWRTVYQRDRHALQRVIQALHTQAVRLGSKAPDEDVNKVIRWFLDPRCKTCGGRGHAVVRTDHGGRTTTRDEPCVACAGTGERPVSYTGPRGRLFDYVQGRINLAGALIAAKLGQT